MNRHLFATAALLVAIVVASDFAAAGSLYDAARQAIELHFVKSKRWAAVVCDHRDVADEVFVYCHPVLDTRIGGLFAITVKGTTPTVHPITGKAKQYMSGHDIAAMDGGRIAVAPWHGDPTQITALLDGFR